jgi:hypothetical protein
MHHFSTVALVLSRSALSAATATVAKAYKSEIILIVDESTSYAPRLDGSLVEGWSVRCDGARFSVDATGFYAVREADESNPVHAALYFAIAGVCEAARA